MQIVHIPSRAIPWLSESIKVAINRGEWLLFSCDDTVDSEYYLDIGNKLIHINENGILGEFDKKEFQKDIDVIIYFSDVKKPESLSNSKFKYFA